LILSNELPRFGDASGAGAEDNGHKPASVQTLGKDIRAVVPSTDKSAYAMETIAKGTTSAFD
jgi:hypothetical protein